MAKIKFPKPNGFFVIQKEVSPTQSVLYKKIQKLEKSGQKLPSELQAAKRKMQKAPKEQVGFVTILYRSKVMLNSPVVDGDLRKFEGFIKDLTKAGKKMNSAKMLKIAKDGFAAERPRDVYVYRDSTIRFRIGMSKSRKGVSGILAISIEKKHFGCFLVGKLVDEKTVMKQLSQVISLLKKGPVFL